MPDHSIEWSPEPRAIVPELATAADNIEQRLPPLSDATNRVLRASSIAPGTFEALVARLDAEGRRALIRKMQ